MPLILALVLALGLPRVSLAAAFPFDPQERYQDGLAAFENQDYALAIELWMDILSNSESAGLEPELVRMIGENVVSAFSASLKIEPKHAGVRAQASRFCEVYTRLHEARAFSESIQDACVDWSVPPSVTQTAPASQDQAPPVSQEQPPQGRKLVQSGPAGMPNPVFSPVLRSPQLKAGLGMLLTAAVTSTFSVVGIVAEGNFMRNYHTSIYQGRADTALRDRADGWRTAAVVSGGVSVALIAVGSLLCLSGTRSKEESLARSRSLRVNGRGLNLRF